MLALLKAGAAFVPLDTEHPVGMLRGIMQPLKPNTILCSAKMNDQAARLAPHSLIIDKSLGLVSYTTSIDREREHNTQPNDLAYALFISGSTGTPKGVQISHSNLSSAIHHQADFLGFANNARSFDGSSYAFDACIFNFFYTIARGACLSVPNASIRKGDLSSFIAKREANLAQLIPSISRTLDVGVLQP
ncbi:putative NRPS-like protein biosynthetic cluster [Trichoderma asperellum]|uniref:putative NRPS-like protein biosynthetic cluster n=1 Tax=Trichoderma asperellum TaxID=101201 RepID=UPI0033302BCF|nr:putative NRPS-like protein biosynthetic cluster [Trichoderma asperellum]